ncbi:ABC transporter substrate-binding protein [Paenibacillaceae bacterium WGS1546]|uniref:ABC transporter substrate-binding protein n=1 Tax=Cohnella sp. WGS1546 TaxID=3366810 RepID=UPI00372D4B56
MKKWLGSMLSVMMLGAVIGCGGGGNGGGAPSGGSSAPGENSSPPDQPKVKLTIAHLMVEEGARVWVADMISSFNAKYPNVEVEEIAANTDKYNTMLKTKIASDDAPDIMLLVNLNDANRDYLEGGFVMDLTDQPFMQNVNSIDRQYIDGKLYALPFDMNANGVIYNKDVFEKSGITEAPRTYSEYKDALEKMKQAGFAGIALGFKENYYVTGDAGADWRAGALSANPDWIEDLQSRKLKFQDDPLMKGILERIADRFAYSQQDPFGTDAATALSLIATGKAGMLQHGSFMVDAIKKINPDARLGFFPFPWSENKEDNNLPLGTGIGGLAVYKDSPNKEWALKFLEEVATKEMGESLQVNKGGLSLIKDVPLPQDPTFQEIIGYRDSGEVFDYTGIRTNFTTEFNNALATKIVEYLMDSKHDVAAALAKLDAEFDRIAKTSG